MADLASSPPPSAPSGPPPASTTALSAGGEAPPPPTALTASAEASPPVKSDAPAAAPDWRASLAGDNTRALETLSRYQTPADFLKAHDELRGKLSQRTELPKITDASTPEQIAEYRKAMDVPEVGKDAKDEAYAEAYGLKLPEGVDVPPALLGAFARQMNSAHIPKATVQKAIGEFAKIQLQVQAKNEQLNDAKAKSWANEMRDELGSKEYDARVSAAKGWLGDKFRDNPEGLQRLASYQAPDGGRLGDDPFFINLFAQQGMQAGHGDIFQANAMESSGRSIPERIREVMSWRTTDRARYDEATQPGGLMAQLQAAAQAKGYMDGMGRMVGSR